MENQTPPLPEKYDSALDTRAHIARVAYLLGLATGKLMMRANDHDKSKLEEPEKSAFDSCVPKLKDMKYGSMEYRAALREMKPALDHHYAANSHHPEHYKDGIAGMSLFDVIEMLIDWKAATERMQDGGDIVKSLEHNIVRFNIEPQLASILRNTIREMEWTVTPNIPNP